MNIQSALDKCNDQYEENKKHSPPGIIVIDKNTHKIVSINPVALNMIGHSEDQVLGQECHGLICPAKRGECPVIDCGQTFGQTDSTLLKENGEHLDILKTIVPMQIEDNTYLIETIFIKSDTTGSKNGKELPAQIPDEQNRTQTECPIYDYGIKDITRFLPDDTLVINKDMKVEIGTEELKSINEYLHTKIKELEKTEKALTLANKKLNLLYSVTRHDILNQLTVIFAYLEIAMNSQEEGEIKDDLIAVEKAGERINDLISFTRLYQDMGTKPPEWQDVHKCFENATLGRVPDSISCSSDTDGINLIADPLLEKVFYNMVDNTLRHGGDVTEIRLSHQSTNDELILIYEDNGVGIQIDEKERIFERSYGKNTGLGLFLIREILGITGMSIIETGEPGKGARFEIHIPIGK